MAARPGGEGKQEQMPNHDVAGAQARPVWMFMVATAMATTISTLAATAMVKAEATEPTAVTCTCEAPAAAAVPVVAPPARPEPPVQAANPPQAPEPHAVAPKAEVRGTYDEAILRRIVRAHIAEVRHCYNQGLAQDPELAGRVSVEFVIGAEGKVTRSVAHSDMGGDVPDCIAKAVGRWMFVRPADGEDVVVTYPFELEPG